MKKTIIPVIIMTIVAGCAINRPRLVETVKHPDGTLTTKSLKVTTYALWPATTTVAQQKVTMGQQFTVGQNDLSTKGDSTNMVEALKALDSILGKIR